LNQSRLISTVVSRSLVLLSDDQTRCLRHLTHKLSASSHFHRRSRAPKTRPDAPTSGQCFATTCATAELTSPYVIHHLTRALRVRLREAAASQQATGRAGRARASVRSNFCVLGQTAPSPINDWTRRGESCHSVTSIRSWTVSSFYFSKSTTASPLLPIC
jgi:hypothetical protein